MRAVVFVDVQNDFVKGGKLAFGFPVEDNVPKVIAFANKCKDRGDLLFATKDTHQKTEDKIVDLRPGEAAIGFRDEDGFPHRITGYMSTLEGKNLPVEHCIKGTKGWEIVDGLVKNAGKINIPTGHIIEKPTFGSNNLRWRIKEAFEFVKEPIDEILICGYCTSICVVSNALMLRAMFPDVPIYVIEDCCGDIDEASHLAALKVMANCQIYAKLAQDA